MKKIAVLNGPNLNRLGKRQPEIYGSKTLDDVASELRSAFPDTEFDFYQSNHEGALVDKLNELSDSDVTGIIFNPAAYSHSSIALRDAISGTEKPVVEVHISNIHSRESFRHHSYTAEVSQGVVAGLGTDGYSLAARYLLGKA